MKAPPIKLVVGMATYLHASAVSITSNDSGYQSNVFAVEASGIWVREPVKRATPDGRFFNLARQWKDETGHYSVIGKRYRHPAYKAILELKEEAIPLILAELRRNPDRWFDALEKLTGEDPASNAETFYEAVDDWIAWGIANEYLA